VTSTCGSLSASTGTSVTYTPPPSLSCTATVIVSTSANPNVRKAFTISVNAPLTISTSSLATGTYGTSYTASLAATGGNSPYTWGLASGNLPPGLFLSTGGVLSGTPTAAGTYSFSIATIDSYTPPDTVQQTFSLTIGKAVLTVTANNVSKTYGAANPSLTPSYTGFLNGDTSAALTGTPNLTTTTTPSSSVNSYPITVTQGTLTAANYSFIFQPGTLTIGAKPLLVTGLSANNKVYDGTTAATLNVSGAVLSGVLNGDTVTLSGTAAGAFAGANVGTGLAANITGLALAGASAGNYTLTQTATLAANITPKPLTVTGLSANSKVYDGTTAATLNGSGAGLSGVVGSDNVTLNSTGYTASFASKTVANGVAVTVSNLALGESAAVNYTLTQPASLTANITPKALTVTGLSANSKIYDGTNAATLIGSPALNGVVLGDTISFSGTAIGSFATKGVGAGIAVNVTGLTLTGASAGNYTLT
jgi:trimeric autotransporter adhesin